MKFDWKEFLSVAKENFMRCQNLQTVDMRAEALCRTAISRAYYAAFHEAKSFVDFEVQTGGAHEKVIKALRASDDKNTRRIGNDLDKLRKLRIRADYDGERYAPRGYADNAVADLQLAISYAETILKRLSATA